MAKHKSRRRETVAMAPPTAPEPVATAPRWPIAWSLGLLTLVSVVLFREIFLHPDEMLWASDIERLFAPFRMLQRQALASGHLPLWDDTILCGRSNVGDPAQVLLSPFAWLSWVSAAPLMMGLYFWVHVTLGAWGVVLWLRLKGLLPPGSILAATAFAFSGKVAAQTFAGHMDVLGTMMTAPWLFWASERLLQSPTWGRAVGLGAVLSVASTASHLPALYWNMFFVAAYVALHCVALGLSRNWPFIRTLLLRFLVAGGVFIVGAMVWWFPIVRQTFLLSARAHSTGDDFAFSTMFSAAPSDLLRMLWPFDGLSLPKAFVSDAENRFFWETASYPGLAVVVLALLALFTTLRRRDTRIFGVLAVFALLMALGLHTPVFWAVFKLVPGVSMTRDPGRLFAYSNLFLGCLAGIGLNQLLAGPTRTRRAFMGIVGAMLLVALMHASSQSMEGNLVGSPMLSVVILVALAIVGALLLGNLVSTRTGAALLIGIAVLDIALLWSVHITTAPTSFIFRSNSVADFLAQRHREEGPFRYYDPTVTVPQQLAATLGLESITGYHPAVYQHQLETYKALWPAGESSDAVQILHHSPNDIVCTPMLDLMNVRYVVAYEPDLDARFRLVFESPKGEFAMQRRVFERVDPLPRAFVVPVGEASLSIAQTTSSVCTQDPRSIAVLDGAHVQGTAAFQAVPSRKLSPSEVALDFATDAHGVLLVSESWHPDWEATDNGQPLPVYRASVGFLGIAVGAGQHAIRVQYQPWDLLLGARTSSIFWLSIAATYMLARLRQARKAANQSGTK